MKSFRDRNPLQVGLISLAAMLALLLLVFSFKRLPFIARSYTLTAEFADAAGLSPENEVRVAGIKVGTVKKVSLGADRVLVALEIRNNVQIPSQSTAAISLKTILGTKFVTIDATKTGQPLGDGDRIPLRRTSIPFEIYQIANTTVDLLTDVNGKQLNDAFDALAGVTADPNRNFARTLDGASKVLDTLGGKQDSIDTIIKKGDEILATLDASTPQITKILKHANVVLDVLAKRRGVVQQLLRNTDKLATQLGTLLRDKRPELDSILDDLHTTLQIVDASLGELQKALALLGPSTEAFARIVWTGRWANICTYALEASLPLPLPPPLNMLPPLGTGPPGPGGPVDCDPAGGQVSASASGSSAASGSGLSPAAERPMNPRAEP
jgi:phospholipid/cholesterol/gamma-HCH transport system substrate-binding protein